MMMMMMTTTTSYSVHCWIFS